MTTEQEKGTVFIMAKFMTTVKEKLTKAWKSVVSGVSRAVEYIKSWNWKMIWDHTTTGLLILFIVSPLLILAYIFLWFILKNG